jgi:hypothetical protein
MTVREVHQSIQKFIIDNALPVTLERAPKFPSINCSVEKGQPLDKKKLIGFNLWSLSLYTYPSESNIIITLYSEYKGNPKEDKVVYYTPLTYPEGTEATEYVLKIAGLLETLLGKPVDVKGRPIVFTLYPEKRFVFVKVWKDKDNPGELLATETGRVDSKEFKLLDQYHYSFEKELAYKKEEYPYETTTN